MFRLFLRDVKLLRQRSPNYSCSHCNSLQKGWISYSTSLWKKQDKLEPYDSRRIIFSGIQPTGVPHLGNYLGALRQWVKIQNEASQDTTLIYSIVDLHAITIKQNRDYLEKWRRETLISLLSVGLDPERSIIFFQSDVSAHTELMWILSCHSSVGALTRMTQWKAKLNIPLDENAKPLMGEGKGQTLQLGLLSYPVLQAADVLVHRATEVPVGQDQAQHLEFTRDLAISFNAAHKPTLVPPETVLSPAKRIMSLSNPASKMSKSDKDPNSRIHITDEEGVIKAKTMKAFTDSLQGISYDPEKRPGMSNLIEIMYHFGEDGATCEEIAERCKDMSKGDFKRKVAACIVKNLYPIRSRYRKVEGDEDFLTEVRRRGAEKARVNAQTTLDLVKRTLGIS